MSYAGIIDKKYNDVIYFEELPINIQHALEILVEWHSVLVYQQKNGRYGFTVIDEYMPNFSNFNGLIESKFVNANNYIQKSIQEIIDNEYKGIRCSYFPKGNLESVSMEISVPIICDLHLGFGFSIELHSPDYGFLDVEKSKIAPAYAHVLDKDELEIGLLNITGPCPKDVSDIREFNPRNIKENITFNNCKKNILIWANSKPLNYDNRWEWSQEMWTLIHDH
jgi:hypothetical protein